MYIFKLFEIFGRFEPIKKVHHEIKNTEKNSTRLGLSSLGLKLVWYSSLIKHLPELIMMIHISSSLDYLEDLGQSKDMYSHYKH